MKREAIYAAMAAVLIAALGASAQPFEDDVERALDGISDARTAEERKREAIRRSCETIAAREKVRYRQLEAAELSEARGRQGPLLALLIEFRKTFSETQIREAKRANIERKRLHEAGVNPEPGRANGLLAHWESKIADIVRPRYRNFAPGRKSIVCPAGARPRPDHFGEKPSDSPSELGVSSAERNQILPPAGSCWGKSGEEPVAGATSLMWFNGGPDDALGKTTVYAAACSGDVAWGWSDYHREERPRLVYPTCVLLDLLDGSLPIGPAPEKYVRGVAVVMADSQPGGGAMTQLPDEKSFVRAALAEAGLPECAEAR